MATYYMRADGTAPNKESAMEGINAATSMSVATHNGETFSAGDVIILKDDGGVYVETFILPSSGSEGSPITYQAADGDTVWIDGAAPNLITNGEFTTNTTGWSVVDSVTLTRRDFTTSPDIDPTGGTDNYGLEVHQDTSGGGYAVQVLTTGAGDTISYSVRAYAPSSNTQSNVARVIVFDGSWSILSNKAVTSEDAWQTLSDSFVNSTTTTRFALHPVSGTANDIAYYDAVVVTGSNNATNILGTDKDYITIDGLRFKNSTTAGIFDNYGDGWVIKNCTFTDNGYASILARGQDSGSTPITGLEIYGNTTGLMDIRGATSALIHNNIVDPTTAGGSIGTGIVITSGDAAGGGAASNGTKVYDNEITGFDGIGIFWRWTTNGEAYKNNIHAGKGVGISGHSSSDGLKFYTNKIHNLTANTEETAWNGIDITAGAVNGLIYNNTIYKVAGNCMTLEADGGAADGWTVKNNVFDSSANIAPPTGNIHSIYVASGVSTFTFDTNLLYPTTYYAEVGATEYDVLANWNAVSGVGTDINGDPLFTNAAGGDFTLQAGSPAIGAGANLGATYKTDYAGEDQDANGLPDQPTNSSPENLATGQSTTPTLESSTFAITGALWEIGAYCYVSKTHVASQWLVYHDVGETPNLDFDSEEDDTNLESIDIPADTLTNDTEYYWRVRHKTTEGWGAYSTSTFFTTIAAAEPSTTSQLSTTLRAHYIRRKNV